MEVKEAKYILAIAKHKSINKAAKALYISQPSLSKYLQNLEYRMDVKLFSHIHNEYVPTYAGQRYIAYARRLVEIETEWKEEYNDLINLKKGELNIAIPIIRSACLIPETMAVFHEEFPDIKVNIYEAADSVEKVLEGEENINLAIYNVNKLPKNFEYQILGYSEVVLVVHKEHPLIRKAVHKEGFRHKWIDLRDVEGESFVFLQNGQTTEKAVREIFSELKMNPQAWMRTRSSEVAIRMAEKKAGITFATEGYVEYLGMGEKLECLSVGSRQITTIMIAAYRKGQYIPGYQQRYIDIVKEVLFH